MNSEPLELELLELEEGLEEELELEFELLEPEEELEESLQIIIGFIEGLPISIWFSILSIKFLISFLDFSHSPSIRTLPLSINFSMSL
ncbi:hypothetical protein AGMMS49531_01620 [Endomicrobiia bacterium]|nr:hypothetical protein AGMMS49531_01620 [Endomicrobiia bacterium]